MHFISDLHFFHKSTLKYRPHVQTLQEMHDYMIEMWNAALDRDWETITDF